MKLLFYLTLLGLLISTFVAAQNKADFEDNEFAEFEVILFVFYISIGCLG